MEEIENLRSNLNQFKAFGNLLWGGSFQEGAIESQTCGSLGVAMEDLAQKSLEVLEILSTYLLKAEESKIRSIQ